jgi:hypothetical protein
VGGGRRFVVCVLLLWPVVACARGRSFSGEPYTRAYVYGVSNLKYVAPKGIQMCLLNTQLPYVHLRSCTFILFIDVTQRIVLYSSSKQFLCMCNQYYDTLLELLDDFRRFNAYSEDCSLLRFYVKQGVRFGTDEDRLIKKSLVKSNPNTI